MLFITRKETERVVIMNEIEIEILKIEDDCVRIGVKAPRDISVHRFEVFEQIKAANRAAVTSKRSVTALSVLALASRQSRKPESADSPAPVVSGAVAPDGEGR